MGEALYDALLRRTAGSGLPGLCAGRRPSRSARLSGAAASGERRQLLVRLGRGRSERAGRRNSAPAANLDRRRRCRAQRKIPLPRDIYRPERQNCRGRRVRRAGKPRRAARRGSCRRRRIGRTAAPLLDGVDVARAARGRCVRRSTARRSASVQRGRRDHRDAPPWRPPPRAFRPGRRPRSTNAPRRSTAPPTGSKRNRGRLIALLQTEGGKTLDDALAEVREAVDYCRYYAAQARTRAGAAADAGADRRKQRAALSRPRRVRLHQPVEFSAGDLSRPGRRRARRRQ